MEGGLIAILPLGVQRSRPSTPQHGGSRSFRVMKSFQGGLQGGMATAFPSPVTFPHYAIQQGIPYNVYGYSPYSPDYTYPTAYYNVYGGGTAQYPLYGGTTACNGMATGTNAFYPYFQFGHGQTGQQYGVTPLSLGLNTPAQVAGMTMALPAPSLPTPAANHYSLIPSQFSTATVREQPLA
ncbi:hypothetical protein HPP92_005651 [Vanilla planifolia]|uniref:Uncharacterized protein n=1 Tax=Vanilla planifolia TaxID=51239 RepID=A0A835RKN3_VANPL|nr:hypothetical protein HPP92_005651 [Vanilla planifolia]